MTDLRAQLQATLGDAYTLERELGGGGMSRVFVATERSLGRKVVVKVLPSEMSGQVSLDRFKREIGVAAALQHAHIVPLLTAGDAGGLPYFTMPFVDGESLRARLAKGGELPLTEAVRILREMASALAYAHSHGVVHRDIKPDNVLISGGAAMVSDFGVAKALSESTTGGSRSGITSLGVALGTPAYMAPEQASADPLVDHRADIYSWGIVAYELLTGQSPYAGRPPQAMLAAHVSEVPEHVTRRRATIPPPLAALVMRCLEKRAADRPQNASELVHALDEIVTPSGGSQPTEARLAAHGRTNRTAWALTGVAAAVVAIVAGWFLLRPSAPALVLGKQEALTSESGLQIQPDISPDGKLVAYSSGNFARMRILIRPVGGGRTIPLSDDSAAVENLPKWSPDGTQLLFLVRGGVSVAPSLGGSSRAVVPPSPAGVTTATWSPTGAEIAFVRGDSLFRAAVDGGSLRFLGVVTDLHSCAWSPDGRWLGCAQGNGTSVQPGSTFGNISPSAIVVVPAGGGVPVSIAEGTSANLSPIWSPDGGRLYFISNRDGARDIYAVDVSSSGHARGAAVRLTTGLNALSLSVSHDGRRLAYAVYSARSNVWSLPVPQGGAVTAAGATPVTSGSQVIEYVSLSADGRWILYDSDLRGKVHIFRIAATGGQPEQLTDGPADEFQPELSPDGRSVAYHSWRTGTRDIEVKPLDGGAVERVTATPAQEGQPAWSPDGRSIAFCDMRGTGQLYTTTRESPGKWAAPRLLAGEGRQPTWSPDGSSIAHTHPRRGRVSVAPADGGAEKVLLESTATEPRADFVRWSPDGKSLFFKSHDASGRASLWTIPVAGGRPRLLVRFDDLNHPSSRPNFATDGKRFFFPMEDRQSNVSVAEVVKK